MKVMVGRCFLVVLCLSLFAACSSEEQQEVEELAVGDIAPDFALKDTDGNIIILSKFSEHPVVLRFFETDCRYCRADTPIINVYFEKYRDTGLKVFYVAAYHESRESVTAFINDLDVSFPIIMDNGAKLADMYNVLLYPQTIMLAPGREVMAIIPGGVGEAELDEMVGPYLQQNSSSAESGKGEDKPE